MMPPRIGPPDIATAMTAPMYPEYRPRLRGGMIVPMIATTRAVSPPMPRPWTTRAASSTGTLWATPARIEPATKITMADCTRVFLLNRSASFPPQIGVLAAFASSAVVMTQAYWV